MNGKKTSIPNKKRKTVADRKRRAARLRRNRVLFFIFAVFYLVLVAIAVISLTIALNHKPRISNDYELVVKNEKAEEIRLYKANKLFINDTLYFPLSAFSEIVDITETKDKNVAGFVFRESGEYAKFTIKTRQGLINGNEIELSSGAEYIDGDLYLPFDFYEFYVKGFDITKNEKKKTYELKAESSTPSFILKKPTSSPAIGEDENLSTSVSSLDFIADLSDYEKYMNPSNRDEYLFLVSSSSPLDENFVPNDLKNCKYTRNDGRNTQKLREYAAYSLEAFLTEAKIHGVTDVSVTSGYRSYEYQAQLFQNEINLTGSREEAAKNVNPPGSSEHQSGLCVDMHNLSSASVAFGDTYEADWLAQNAHKFGYILRYPEDKTDITGISYEPWHFRYVGRYHATKMYELDMCLEEYIQYVNR